MTVHIGGISASSVLPSGLAVAWSQGWPLVTIILALEAVVFPFIRFGLLSLTLAAIRFGRRDKWLGTGFRYSEIFDQWAMFDVLLIGAGIGYGRMASQLSVTIGAGGWCFVAASFMTMITRASLERREVWRRLSSEPAWSGPGAISCTSCDLLLPPEAEGQRCPRCSAKVHRRHVFSETRSMALLLAAAILTPIGYGYPMSELWKAGSAESHTVIDGIRLLFVHGFWYFGVVIFFVSVTFPLTKLASLAWFLISIRRGSSWRLRAKTKLYRFVDEIGRWSTLDPFTVMIFSPMIQLGQLAHFDFMGGAAAFLATVVLSMLAIRAFDPRLLWDNAPVQQSEASLRVEPAKTNGFVSVSSIP